MTITNIDALIDAHYDAKNSGVNKDQPNQLELGATYLFGNKDHGYRVIGNFDVGIVAASTINAVSLFREISLISGPGSAAAFISRCTRPADWVEGEVTWDDYKSSTAWTDAGGDFDDTGPPAKVNYTEASGTGELEITGLLALVTDARANRSHIVSIVLRLDDEDPGNNDYYRWKPSEHSDSWYLEIDHTPPAAGGTDLMRGRWG